MEILLELIDVYQTQAWAYRALVASTLVGIMCGVLGCFIVLRNMALIGDAISHAILPGVVFAFILTQAHNSFYFFIGAVIAGLLMAAISTWLQQNVRTENDAAIGIVFTAMFAIGVIGISAIAKGGGVHLDLKDFLIGNILGIGDQDLVLTSMVFVYVLLGVIVLYRYLFATTFQPVVAATMGISVSMIHYFLMLLLSFAVVASLQTVGVILVVALLITPAATALLLADRLPVVIILAGLIGGFAAILGLNIAIIQDAPPGPVMVVTATVLYGIAVVFSPKRGLLVKWRNRLRVEAKIQREHILKYTFKNQGATSLELEKKLGLKQGQLKSSIKKLTGENFIALTGDKVSLTAKGKKEAERLVRAHRLWETYLVDQVGLSGDQIHPEADEMEHFLTDEILDEVDEKLGYPSLDPHGSPIPPKSFKPGLTLIQLLVGHQGKITTKQADNGIIGELWKLGLNPNSAFSLSEKTAQDVVIIVDGREIRLPLDFAEIISVQRND